MNEEIISAYSSLDSSTLNYGEILDEIQRITSIPRDEIDREVSDFIKGEVTSSVKGGSHVHKLSYDAVLECAATKCFERACYWKKLEQDAYAHRHSSLAKQYSLFCEEADQCKRSIRMMKGSVSLDDEISLIKHATELLDGAYQRFHNPAYRSLRDELLELIKRLPSSSIILP